MESEQRKPDWQKRQLILALVTTVLLAAVLGTLAWFQYTRKLQTITEVHVPTLWLDNISTVDLGEIDVENAENGQYRKRYVFAVVSNEGKPFLLQLAHTTNIPFTYTIYNAVESQDVPSGDYEAAGGVYYTVGSAVEGGYVNREDPGLANRDYHVATYGEYTNVQKNAEPLYWKSDSQAFAQNAKPYISYYILEVSWGSGGGTNVYNTKETDLIYLMAITDGTSGQ